jgi:hypothetical protein
VAWGLCSATGQDKGSLALWLFPAIATIPAALAFRFSDAEESEGTSPHISYLPKLASGKTVRSIGVLFVCVCVCVFFLKFLGGLCCRRCLYVGEGRGLKWEERGVLCLSPSPDQPFHPTPIRAHTHTLPPPPPPHTQT